jgi:apolipoprotein N-acyltransferase
MPETGAPVASGAQALGAMGDAPAREMQGPPELAGAARGARAHRRFARSPWVLALALAAGAVHAASFAPADLPWLELLALACGLYLASAATSTGTAARIGLAFGLGWFGVGVSWTYISLHKYGELAAPIAVVACAALAALLALFPAVAAGAAALAGPPRSARRAFGLAGAWTLAEWARGVAFGGFPWVATGYAHADGPLAGFAPVLGVYGIGAIAALLATLPLWALGTLWSARAGGAGRTRRMPAVLALIACLGLPAAGQMLRSQEWSRPQGAPIKVRLVQGDIPQDLKFGAEGLDRAVERYLPMLLAQVPPGTRMARAPVTDPARTPAEVAAAAPDLIVFPESAFPVPVNELPDYVLQAVGDPQLRSGAALIMGIFIAERGFRYYNSAIGLGPDPGDPQRYSKRHLVPFGEFIPFGMHWFVQMLNIPIGDQEAGDQYQAPMSLAGERVAVNICFEDLFGADILAAWHDPKQAPTLLLNLSNLAWFDDSWALPQHLQASRMRAMETARPLLRATNTGVTAIIDEHGRVLAKLPIRTAGALEGLVQGRSGSTPFIAWGNAPTLLFAALAWGACFLRERQTARAVADPAAA